MQRPRAVGRRRKRRHGPAPQPQPVDYGFVGDIEQVDSALLRRLLEDGMAPVFSAIMHDGKGTLLNCNADSVASAVALGAAEIAPTDLVFCFEKAGVLRDPDDDTSLIREITAATYPPLKADGVVSKGMIPKIENALKAVEKGAGVTIEARKPVDRNRDSDPEFIIHN